MKKEYCLRLEHEAAVQWLLQSITKSLTTYNRDPERFSDGTRQALEEILDAAHQALQDGPDAGTKSPTVGKNVAVPKQKTHYCPKHTTYQAKRPPRVDCQPCWAAYGKLNPMVVAQARSRFERKMRGKGDIR